VSGSDSLPDPALLERLFPHLEITELLGQGGMGAVYKARQPSLDRLVALKILPRQADHDPAFAERFVREARALARLNHPNIVAVYDFGSVEGIHFLIMEYVDGANLREAQKDGQLTPAEALRIVPRICEALQYAHEEGVVHRDIKPENVLIDKKGRVKIADFGLARILGQERPHQRLTRVGDVMGTPHYMAPEQIEHPQQVDHRADIFSLGVVFYELLTGELPLGRFAPPSRKVEVDVRIDDVVLRALEKEPERRYQQANEVKTAVEAIAHTRPGTPAAHARPRARTLALVTASLALVVLCAGLGRLLKARHEMSPTFSPPQTPQVAPAVLGAVPKASPESAPPVVVSTLPQSGLDDVDPTLPELRVTFSKPMKDQNWSWSTWGEGTYPDATGKPYYLDDGLTCVLPVKLEPGHLYAIWLNSDRFQSFQDRDGRPSLPYLLIFKTRNTSLP
jgi:serine/threonine protein kinase